MFEPKVLFLETTTRCNAACPMCPRQFSGILPDEGIPLRSMSLEWVKRHLDKDFIQSLEWIVLCGNYGEPTVAVDCLEILQYFREAHQGIILQVHTNGGARKPVWWSELASIADRVTFSIDGLQDTNHLYRRNVRWSRLLENARSFIEAGGFAEWAYLVFEHNEHQVDQAYELSRELGFKTFSVKRTSRFMAESTGRVEEAFASEGFIFRQPTSTRFRNRRLQEMEARYSDDGYDQYLRTTQISCKAKRDASVYLGADGLLFPCCYLALIYGKSPLTMSDSRTLLDKLPGELSSISVERHSIESILRGEFFSKVESSWNTPDRLKICARACGECDLAEEQNLLYDYRPAL